MDQALRLNEVNMARDIGEWLDGLDLGRYAEAFADNEIDLDALPFITEKDLSEIGVALGSRRKLLAAIAELGDSGGTATEDEKSGERSAGAEAERRQLTVMFCDLVGSTALAERLDPEDLREVIRAYQETCAEAVARFDGHLAKYIGDGLLVYFGYPQAHEDDARRAVSAGLGIVEGVGGLNQRLAEDQGVKLGVRVGIHTGLVIAGEMGGGETREADAIVGETPNVAARLEGLAKPNTVAISAETQALVEGLFECENLGLQRLRGVSEAVKVHRVLGESDAPSRFEAAVERGLTELVGREEEVGLLLKRWAYAKDGDGQVVLLSGEAGVGKSRIVRAFRRRLENETHSRVLYFGSPYHQNSAFYPATEQFQRALRFGSDNGPNDKLDKLEAALDDLGLSAAELAPILASLLSLPVGDRYTPLELVPEQLKAKILEANIAVFEAMAAQQPILMVIEDAHWIDPSTLELLSMSIERLRTKRILMLITFRPEFDAPWAGHAHVTAHALNRLGRKDAMALVAKVTKGKPLPDEVLSQIVAKTDGVPLYVEELTKTVLESGVLQETEKGHVLTGPLAPLAIPASLKDSLMARLDRLAPVKEVAQLASVLGRIFDHTLLAAISPLDDAALNQALDQLVGAGLMYRRGMGPDQSYEFKHALVQDAAYQSLLNSTRQQFHGRIAQVLEERFPAITETQPELLAHHLAEADLAERAIPYWLLAGQRATERSANLEAVAHFTRGLTGLENLPDSRDRAEKELALQIALGAALFTTRGYGAAGAQEAYERARRLAEHLGDDARHFAALWGLWFYNTTTSDFLTSQDLATDVLAVAERQSEKELQLQAHHAAWTTDILLGKLVSGIAHVEKGELYYDADQHHGHKFVFGGHDPGVCGHNYGSHGLWLLGYPDKALRSSDRAVSLATEIAHPNSQVQALAFGAILRFLRRETAAARQMAEAAVAFSQDHGLPTWMAPGQLVSAWASVLDGEAEGVAQIEQALSAFRARGAGLRLPLFLGMTAEVFGVTGRIDEALGLLDDAMSAIDDMGERWAEAEIYRLKGNLLLKNTTSRTREAEASFRRALETAREQQARSLELRAATNLAHHWSATNRKAEARDLLAPIYDWFTEGFDTPDLKDAKTLLDDLS
jgi:predicted ATPase/class 3 adenylate cyclase